MCLSDIYFSDLVTMFNDVLENHLVPVVLLARCEANGPLFHE